MKRYAALLLTVVLLLVNVTAALAETWTCPSCNHSGNSGKYCEECGRAKPAATEAPKENKKESNRIA